MSLDLAKLDKARTSGGKTVARCPACREVGGDSAGNHLVILPDGKWGCVANPGPTGKEHRRRIAELAGEHSTSIARPSAPAPRSRPASRPAPKLPVLRPLPADLMRKIARTRGWATTEGAEVLVDRGQLFFAEVWDNGQTWPAWVVTDPTRANAQARRMDGARWEGINAKAKSLPGTTAARVIGSCLIGTCPEVWLVEGTPDLLAAAIVAKRAGLDLDHIAFVCITGAGNPLHAEDLPAFVGKLVIIAMHHDAQHGQGARAASNWARQLYQAGAAQVRGFDFAGIVKDLSDYLAASFTLAAPPPPPASASPASSALAAPSGFARPPAFYDATPRNESYTTTVFFNTDGTVAEIHRPERRGIGRKGRPTIYG